MNFRVDPVVVVSTLHSMLEQKNSRMTTVQAVHELAAKGLVLPGKTDKEQAQILTSLISLCNLDFLDVRPGKGGGVGLPSMRSATGKASKRATVAGMMRDAAEDDSTTDSDQEIRNTGT
jgi:hypothetical protein